MDRRVWSSEVPLTVLLGVLLVSGGSKGVVRWTMWAPATPFFGVLPGPEEGRALQVIEGAVAIVVGALVLRLHRSAPTAVTVLSAATIASVVLSWPLWDDYVARYVEARRAYQGLPVRPGEIAFMRRSVPLGAIAFEVAATVIALGYRARFGTRTPSESRPAVPERDFG